MMRQQLICLAALLAITLASGCSTAVTYAKVGPQGEPITYKRYERHAERDYMHHFTRHIYDHPGAYFRTHSPDQAQIVDEYGAPDFIRKFRAMDGERVREWVFLGKAMIFQFIDDDLVYTGPITDMEQTLLRRGRPDYYDIYFMDFGTKNINLIYANLWFKKIETLKFSNDKLILSTEGN